MRTVKVDRLAGLMVRLLFVLVLAALSVIMGMWLGLTAVKGYRLAPRQGIIKCESTLQKVSVPSTIEQRRWF